MVSLVVPDVQAGEPWQLLLKGVCVGIHNINPPPPPPSHKFVLGFTPCLPGLGTRDPRLRHLRHGVQDPSQILGQLVALKQLCWKSKLYRHVLPAAGSASHSFQAALMTLIECLSPVELSGSSHRCLGGTREFEGTVLGMALPSGELGYHPASKMATKCR